MAEEDERVSDIKPAEVARPTPRCLGSDVSPVVYFENWGGMRHDNGIITIELAVARPVAMSDESVPTIFTSVCYLKGSADAFASLKTAIENGLAMFAAPKPKPN